MAGTIAAITHACFPIVRPADVRTLDHVFSRTPTTENGMDRRSLIVNGLAAGAAATLMRGAGRAQAAASLRPRPVFRGRARNVVLVHGAYADGSCWSEVIERLQAAGVTATAVQNPLRSVADDVAATRLILARHAEPTILVGHSYGGTVITEAGTDPQVVGLVYIAARRDPRSSLSRRRSRAAIESVVVRP